MRFWLVAGLIAGCRFEPVNQVVTQGDDAPVIDTQPIDAPADARPDAFDPLCFGTGPFIACLPALPTTPLTLTANTYTDINAPGLCDSGAGIVVDINGIPSCVFAGTTITVNELTTGALPLVFVATDSITITLVDARAALGNGPGPNSDASQCGDLTTTAGAASAAGGGGGAGGTFIGPGGAGGSGDVGGVAGGTHTTPQDLAVLRGGCAGGAGGAGTGAPARGGDGGGAVFVVARNSITINGTLTVSGAGGAGGTANDGGGGGGGSGGMIVLDAPTLTIGPSAQIIANGGGGGGGAAATVVGGNGTDSTTLTGAAGGIAGTGATPGGTGGFGSTAAAPSTQATLGGGGGGGGVGAIYVISGQTIPAANVSPPPVVSFH